MRRRILLVTRRFWPLGAPEESHLLELAAAWKGAGAEVSVVTPQWDKTWPTRLVVREMKVTRLPYAPKRLWGGYWYLRRLNQWVRQARNQFDVIVVWRLQFDALLAIRLGRDLQIPVVLLYEGCGPHGDAAWLRQSRYGSRILAACKQASALVAFNETSLAEAHRLALEPSACHGSTSMLPEEQGFSSSREAARIHLLESNRDFFTTPATPVGITFSSLEDRATMAQLFSAWRQLRRSHQDARLWWIGDGPKRSSLYAMLGDFDLRYHAVLPGDFDDTDDLFSAADFYVAHNISAAKSIPQALSKGLPVFAADLPDIRGMVPPSAPVRFVRSGDVESLARMLCQACDAPEETRKWRSQAREWAAAQTPNRQVALSQLAMFDALRPTLAEKSEAS